MYTVLQKLLCYFKSYYILAQYVDNFFTLDSLELYHLDIHDQTETETVRVDFSKLSEKISQTGVKTRTKKKKSTYLRQKKSSNQL